MVLSLTCCILVVVGSRFDARREIGQTDPSTTLSWITFKSIQIMRTFPKRGKYTTQLFTRSRIGPSILFLQCSFKIIRILVKYFLPTFVYIFFPVRRLFVYSLYTQCLSTSIDKALTFNAGEPRSILGWGYNFTLTTTRTTTKVK